jgi:hypothetical protein
MKKILLLLALLPSLALAVPTQCMPDQAKKDFADGVTETGDTLKLVLVTSSSTISASSTTCAGANGEVASGGGYTTGGATLTRGTTTISANHALLNFTSPVTWTTATFTARGAYICNTTTGNIMAIYDFGSDKTSSGGDFVVTLPAGVVAIN